MTDLQTPLWNLDTIYSGFKNEDYLKALEDFDNNFTNLKNIFLIAKDTSFNQNDFFYWLLTVLPQWNYFAASFESLSAYAYCTYSVETTNTEYLNNLSNIEKKSLLINELQIYFSDIITKNKDFLHSFCTTFPQYQNYQYIFENIIQEKQHEMSLPEENLAIDMQRTAGDAWSRLHEQIISNLVDNQTNKTFNQLRNEAYSESREVRQTAYKKELNLLEQNKIALAACLNNIKGETLTLNKRRQWQTPIQRACFSSRLSEKTLNALISAIEQSLPFWRDYLNTKAQILNIDKCAFYDLFAPLTPNESSSTKKNNSPEKTWSFKEAKEYIIQKISAFSDDFGNFVKMAFENNWIDAKVRQGKVGGAYCQDFPLQKESRVLSNFTGTFSDITTLAHELGHAFHHWCIKDLDYSLTQYPMTLAETASIFAETILMKDAIENSSGFEKAKLIEMHLQDSCQVLVDILSRFYFEKSVFDCRQTSELSSDDFCSLMLNAQEKTYGSGLSDEKHPYIWAVKSHYYSPHLDFYNFPYAFGLLFATALFNQYQKAKNQNIDFAPIYKSILQNTGSFSCEEVCKKAGFDIENIDFWLSGIESFKLELDELKNYANSLKNN